MMSRRPSPLDNEQCRQCQSFSDYVKSNTSSSGKQKRSSKPVPREDCPLDREKLGHYTWSLLHTIAAKYPEKPNDQQKTEIQNFFKYFSKLYPCEVCRADFKEDLKQSPPQVQSQQALSQWLCRLHNKVNEKIGKEQFDCSKVNERWRDGWLDGSCD